MSRFVDPTPSKWRLLVVMMGILLGSACDDPVSVTAPVPASARATVTGTVVDAGTREPVSGAKVSVGIEAITTGSDGRFVLTGIPAGPAKLRCVATGFRDFQVDLRVPSSGTTQIISLAMVDVSETLGVYQLTAWIQGYDPGWGVNMQGGSFTAVVSFFRESPGTPGFRGTLTDWQVTLPAERLQFTVGEDGTGTGRDYLDPDGVVVFDADKLGWHLQGSSIDSGDIAGTWGCCGHISGVFTAVRR